MTKMHECSWCNRMVEDREHADDYYNHAKGCTIREIMEVRLANHEAEERERVETQRILDLKTRADDSGIYAEDRADGGYTMCARLGGGTYQPLRKTETIEEAELWLDGFIEGRNFQWDIMGLYQP